MKKKLKKILHRYLLSTHEIEKLGSENIAFPGGIRSITDTEADDVFIVGFPKSGNTLMQHIIAHLVYGLNDEASRSMVNLIVPDIYANSHYFRFNDRCFFKSHDLPKPAYKKVIYIMRDGREALLSYYHMMKNMGKPVSLDDLYSDKIKLFDATWSEHIKQWENNPYKAEILWVKFEDLKANKFNELKRICAFLNITCGDNELEAVIEHTSLQHMKALEQRKDWVKMNKHYFVNDNTFIRKGKTNSFLNEVSKEIVSIFETQNAEMLSKYYR